VAACPVPTISAVGHEVDFTLCDFAADRRAETPSAAAELVSSEFVRFAERTESAARAARAAVEGAVDRARERVAHGRSRLRLLSPAALVERGYLRLDDMSNRLAAALRSSTQSRRQALSGAAARLEKASPELRVRFESQRLLSLYKRLQGASPGSVLNRGFAIVRDDGGKPITRRAAIRAGQRLEAEFADGRTRLRAEQG
jgi:exodeoxyribonuclease VII large subunit